MKKDIGLGFIHSCVRMAMSASPLSPVGPQLSVMNTDERIIAMKLGADIHGPQRTNSNLVNVIVVIVGDVIECVRVLSKWKRELKNPKSW